MSASLIALSWLGLASAAQAQTASPTPDAAATAGAASAPAAAPAAAPADAQPGTQTPPAAGTQTASADEDQGGIVIQARRRAESAIDAPLAVTAIGERQMREQNIVTVSDLNRVAPNVVLRQTNSGGGTIDVIIRGQSIPLSNIAIDPSVGFYIDDVIVQQGKGIAAGLFDISSIEVARGVQGTLRGRNNTGGAISIYTNKPELGVTDAEVSGTYGSHNYVQGQAWINLPLEDTLSFRGGFQRITQDGWGRSIVTGQQFGGRNQWIGRASLLFKPSSNFTAWATYEHIDINQNPLGRRAIPGSAVYQALITGTRSSNNASGLHLTPDQIIPTNFWDNSNGYVLGNDRAKIDFWRGQITYSGSRAFNAKVISGYRNMFALGGIDLDGTPALNNESENGGTSHQFTIEPQIYGDLGKSLSYILGYYYFNDSGALVADTFPYIVNAAAPNVPFRNHIVIREGGKNTSNAVYGHLELKPVSGLELAAGLRYTWDDRQITPNRVNLNSEPSNNVFALYQAGTIQAVGCGFTTAVNGVQRPAGGFVLVNGAAIASGPCPMVTIKRSFDYLSYEFSARYEFTRGVAVYARTGQGEKSGGINIPVASIDTPVIFDPERVRDYEVGLKADSLLNHTLALNLALYYSDYRNLQRNIGTLLEGTSTVATVTVNAGRARVQGIEADFNWHPVDGLSISGFAGYTDAKYKQFTTLGANGLPVDLSSQPFYATPKFTSRLGFVYALPMAGGTFRFGGGWNHQSNTSFQAIFFPGAESGIVDLFDARISWTTADKKWEFAIYGTNLSNDKYLTSAQANRVGISTAAAAVATAYGTPGDPRFVGASVTWHYGGR
ncbi:MAG TPA: TonB-dependent receptor [Allosphingosinicella sp.]|nr:TonB-dependent receptor [Allosphingosinicella sp.]